MSVQRCSSLQRYGLPLGILVWFGLWMLISGAVVGQDLSDGVSSATAGFKSIIKTVFSIAAGGTALGGSATAGSASGGSAPGGSGTGGSATGGSATGGSGTGGSGTGGAATACNVSVDCLPGNVPVPSSGCGTQGGVALLSSGAPVSGGLSTSYRLTMVSGGNSREYIVDVPADYDNNHAYRLFFAFHSMASTDTAVATGQVANGTAATYAFYGLQRMAIANTDPAIFVAPQAKGVVWGQADHVFFDDLLALVKAQLCIDNTRVFLTGFSAGATFTYSVSLNHQNVVRAAVAMAPSNFDSYMPTDTHRPIPWMSTTGMSDPRSPWVSGDGGDKGARFIALSRGLDNGCTIPADVPTTSTGSRGHICYDFQDCGTGYPVKACTFDGTGQCAVADGGNADNVETSWIPGESWRFFAQF